MVPKVDKTDYVLIVQEPLLDQKGLYRPVCEPCHYIGPDLGNADNAMSLLNRHRETRDHRTNKASPFRFVL